MTPEQAIAQMKRPTLVVDMEGFKALHAAFPIPKYEAPDARIYYRSRYDSMPVIHSKYLIRHNDYAPPSILHEFDRWFAAAVRRHRTEQA